MAEFNEQAGKKLDATGMKVRIGMDVVPPYNRYLQINNEAGDEVGTVMFTEDQARSIASIFMHTFKEVESLVSLSNEVESIFTGLEFPESA